MTTQNYECNACGKDCIQQDHRHPAGWTDCLDRKQLDDVFYGIIEKPTWECTMEEVMDGKAFPA